MKKLKWGSSHLFITNSLYFVVHLDGSSAKNLENIKNDRLFGKLSTIKATTKNDERLREATPDHFSYKRRGGSFPFIKIYVVDFIYSGGLWQHEIGIEKVF